jgi:hypothetical protein
MTQRNETRQGHALALCSARVDFSYMSVHTCCYMPRYTYIHNVPSSALSGNAVHRASGGHKPPGAFLRTYQVNTYLLYVNVPLWLRCSE